MANQIMTGVSVARSKRALPGLASECETATDCLTGVCGFVWGATKGFQHPYCGPGKQAV